MPVAEGEDSELVVIQSLHAESLLTSIRVNAENGINPFDVIVKVERAHGQWQEIQLTRKVWMNCLLRGNSKADMFLNYVLIYRVSESFHVGREAEGTACEQRCCGTHLF